MTVRDLRADQDIVRDQDRPSQCCLILTGFACRYKMTPAGKRQIFSFHIPGDIPDMQSIHLRVMDHSLGTLTASKVAFIPHEHVRALNRRCPRIADVFWRDTLIDAAVFREWMAGLGRREAFARIAHLLCELFLRFKAVGLANGRASSCRSRKRNWRCARIVDGSRQPHASGAAGQEPDRLARRLLTVPDWEALKAGGRVRSDLSPLAVSRSGLTRAQALPVCPAKPMLSQPFFRLPR